MNMFGSQPRPAADASSAAPRKLIEVALPLEAINEASAREKSIRHGHPSTLHLWWARRPLAAARAVLFAQMVDDPSAHPELFPTEEAQQAERERLFDIIEELVQWENTTNEEVLQKARREIRESWRRTCERNAGHARAAELFDPTRLPAFHDPFAGGGSIPLEAQRLGLEAWASDLNPVAVLINKAMIEIPPRFAGRAPVNPDARCGHELIARPWKGAQGLAEDVRSYGQWMRTEAERRIGTLYPKVRITDEMIRERPDLERYRGRELTVIAWIWARTVRSPNPAFANIEVPLASTFMLSTKSGKEAYVEPVIEHGGYRFRVKVGVPKNLEAAKRGTSAGKRSAFRCIMSDTPISYDYIRAEGKAGRMGARLMAIVAEGDNGRVYLSPNPEHEEIAQSAAPGWKPEIKLEGKCRVNVSNYGIDEFGDLFTPRQLVALTTFADLVPQAIARIEQDALAAGLADDRIPLAAGGSGARAYAEAVGVYLGLAVNRMADRSSSISSWDSSRDIIRNTFSRQAIPMVWDYAEANPFCDSTGNWMAMVDWTCEALSTMPATPSGTARQEDAQVQTSSRGKVLSTDPPYYDNIGYADLSDFFYVWLRRTLRPVYPDLFGTLAVPKADELVATPYRHGSKEEAERFFLAGMQAAMHRLAEQAHPVFPVTIYYAFKQSEEESELGVASTGWETFLSAVIQAGFAVTGTWPIRTELSNRMVGIGTNALASSIVLVCRPRPQDAPTGTRREFVSQLKAELPEALRTLQRSNIAPVDLAQAAIGPGMAIFTRYARILDAEGRPLTVRDALALINQVLDETIAEQEGDFDAESRWALAWFEQYGFDEGEFGVAETLSKAKDTSVDAMVDAGILYAAKGKVRLLRPAEYPSSWNPAADRSMPVWETLHQLIRSLETKGEAGTADVVRDLGSRAEPARELCYRLYTVCERKRRAAEALAYNSLVQSWPEIQRLAQEKKHSQAAPGELF
jgi:putative DNA methylase